MICFFVCFYLLLILFLVQVDFDYFIHNITFVPEYIHVLVYPLSLWMYREQEMLMMRNNLIDQLNFLTTSLCCLSKFTICRYLLNIYNTFVNFCH